jgi:hypothetical protein
MLGFGLVPLAAASNAAPAVGYADIATVSKEANDVIATIAEGLADDGRLDGSEVREVRREIADNGFRA